MIFWQKNQLTSSRHYKIAGVTFVLIPPPAFSSYLTTMYFGRPSTIVASWFGDFLHSELQLRGEPDRVLCFPAALPKGSRGPLSDKMRSMYVLCANKVMAIERAQSSWRQSKLPTACMLTPELRFLVSYEASRAQFLVLATCSGTQVICPCHWNDSSTAIEVRCRKVGRWAFFFPSLSDGHR